MRVITQKSLLENIFTELQKIELNKGSCHYGDYEQWCVRGEDVEQAIKNLFLEDGIFKPTKDLIHCNECKFNRGIGCPFHEEVKHNKNDFCSYAEVLYNQGYRPKEEVQKETARKILKRIAYECIIGIDSNLKCMADQKDINTLWHNCLGKKTACQGIYDVVIELQEEYGVESEETE